MATTITFRLTDEEKKELEMIAEKMGMTVSQVIRIAIKNYLESQSDKNDDLIIKTF